MMAGFTKAWIGLESIMLSEMSYRERKVLSVITYMGNLKNKTKSCV